MYLKQFVVFFNAFLFWLSLIFRVLLWPFLRLWFLGFLTGTILCCFFLFSLDLEFGSPLEPYFGAASLVSAGLLIRTLILILCFFSLPSFFVPAISRLNHPWRLQNIRLIKRILANEAILPASRPILHELQSGFFKIAKNTTFVEPGIASPHKQRANTFSLITRTPKSLACHRPLCT